MRDKIRYLAVGTAFGFFLMGAFLGGAVADRLVGISLLDHLLSADLNSGALTASRTIIDEESVVTRAVEQAAPSVITVSISKTTLTNPDFSDLFSFGPFGLFNIQPEEQKIEQDIGTGFVIDSSENLIVTNKHVVADTQAEYRVVTQNDDVLQVTNIYRDPVNDLAILKVDNSSLPALNLGDSNNLKVGQKAIAIGTALGEFRHTVTTGVISGLGRGITAGSPLEGYVERLDNVIQTDAAINPGNSGGPLLNSAGEVIGVNVAVSPVGENIGFAIPINVVKDSLENFHSTGEFSRPYLGVRYQLISKQAALLNEVPQGAYVREVIENSPAQKAGVRVDDIITQIDGQKLDNESKSLAEIISTKKAGDNLKLEIWRDGEVLDINAVLEAQE
ncbi:MAG: trypsin-like peptidase domain-containing protein [Candidatus Shapirobacteria bacterium]